MRRLLERLKSGLIVPAGQTASTQRQDSESYLDVKQKALRLEAYYKRQGVAIPPRSGLDLLIQSAKKLSDEWLINQAKDISEETFIRAVHLNRVSEAILSIERDNNIKDQLRRLTSGTLDLNSRELSPAKNFLWELELLQNLRRHQVNAQLKEPPDIMVFVNDQK